MDLLCKQIGLNLEREARGTIYFMIRLILKGLRGYSDNGPVGINGPGRLRTGIDAEDEPEYTIFLEALNALAHHKIILFKFINMNYKGPNRVSVKEISVFVTNRYKLERLYAELKWLGEPEDKRSNTPHVDNIIYYDISTGKMFFNGLHKTLTKRNKKLLDALFLASPNSVPRKKLLTIARSESKYAHEPSKTVVTEAFTNLRKVCGVSGADAIKLAGDGKLNAHIYPLKSQLPPPDFITD